MSAAPTPTSSLRIMPRELRMMSERIFSMTGQPKGFFLALQDLPMCSQALGLGGILLLESRFDALSSGRPESLSIVDERDGALRLDAAGLHAWLVVPAVIDLLGELVARFGAAEITVTGLLDPQELKLVETLGCRTGLAVTVDAGETVTLAAAVRPLTGDVRHDDPQLWSLLDNGLHIDAELWWRIYFMAKKALAPDSVVSRRHAGPMIVQQDGTVIGRKDNDDETDISFLMQPRPSQTETEGKNP